MSAPTSSSPGSKGRVSGADVAPAVAGAAWADNWLNPVRPSVHVRAARIANRLLFARPEIMRDIDEPPRTLQGSCDTDRCGRALGEATTGRFAWQWQVSDRNATLTVYRRGNGNGSG